MGAAKKLASYGLFGGVPGAYATNDKFKTKVDNFLFGTPEVRENVSTLRPEQEALYQQLQKAGMEEGAGGAWGDSADYYRGLLSDDSADYQAFSAPMLRQYNEEIVPGLSEQFAGMGSGGLSSSGFRNAQIQGATDLSERLGALRANLRMQGAQGLQGIGQAGLGNYSQNMVTEQGTPGLIQQALPALANAATTAATAYFGGPAAATASAASNAFGGNKVGANSSPYGSPGTPSGWQPYSNPGWKA